MDSLSPGTPRKSRHLAWIEKTTTRAKKIDENHEKLGKISQNT